MGHMHSYPPSSLTDVYRMCSCGHVQRFKSGAWVDDAHMTERVRLRRQSKRIRKGYYVDLAKAERNLRNYWQ